MRKALPLKFFSVDDDCVSTPGAKTQETAPIEIDFRPQRLILDPKNVSSFYAVNLELLKFPPISFEPLSKEEEQYDKPKNWDLDMKWLNLSADVTNPFPKNRTLVKHELQKSYNVRFDEENLQQHMESKAVLSEYSKISENYKKMKNILEINCKSSNGLENKKKKKEFSINIEDDVTRVFVSLNNKQKQLKKKLQTLPFGQHYRRKSCQSSWSGGISKLEKKLETRVWNNEKHLPKQRSPNKTYTISAVAKSKIVVAKKKFINRLKTKNPFLKKPSRTLISHRVSPAIEGGTNAVGSSVKLSSETEFDTLSVTSRHENKTPENVQKSHFRRYSQLVTNTKRSRDENGELASMKLANDGSPLTGDKLGLQEDSPYGRRKSKTVTETLAVIGSKDDISPKVISIFGQNLQTPMNSGGIYTFDVATEEKNEVDSGLKIQIKPMIIFKKEESVQASTPQSAELNKENVAKELTNLKKDMKKVKGYLKHVKKRSLKKSKLSKSKVIQQQQDTIDGGQVIQTEPTAEILMTEPIEEIKTARSRQELAKIFVPPQVKSVTKVKNIYNNSLNFGLNLQDLKWIENKSPFPFKETSRSPLTSLSRDVRSTQLMTTTNKIGSPYLMPSHPSINAHSLLSYTNRNEKSSINPKTLQDVIVEQKGFTERMKGDKRSSINLQPGLPQINKSRPKIQIKAWDEGLSDRKNLPSGINSCSSRRLNSRLSIIKKT